MRVFLEIVSQRSFCSYRGRIFGLKTRSPDYVRLGNGEIASVTTTPIWLSNYQASSQRMRFDTKVAYGRGDNPFVKQLQENTLLWCIYWVDTALIKMFLKLIIIVTMIVGYDLIRLSFIRVFIILQVKANPARFTPSNLVDWKMIL